MLNGARFDAAAITASMLCMVHCLALPVIVALLPAASHFIDLPEWVHMALFVFAVPVSAYAMIVGYRLHGWRVPSILAASGLGLLGVGALGELSLLYETGISVLGSLLLLLGHVINLRRRRDDETQSATKW
jgi:hypothetical protein